VSNVSTMAVIHLALALAAVTACSPRTEPQQGYHDYDPIAAALHGRGRAGNPEASVPPMCYTATDGLANPCWVCHTAATGRNYHTDWDVQVEYRFSDAAKANYWSNLFVDRQQFIASVADDDMLEYVRQDNYAPLRQALASRSGYPGYVPDLDLAAGFADDGLARDGSRWRAVRYHPLAGSFWPTNGSADDVFVRLPPQFATTEDGTPSMAVYRANLSLVEAAIAGAPAVHSRTGREIEPTDEALVGFDLDGDGHIGGQVTVVRRLPPTYAGGARTMALRPYLFPLGTELLHSVRYLDPDAPELAAARMKELRYARKVQELDDWALARAYERELDEKAEGRLPVYRGSALIGLRNAWGWQLQGFIEDQHGRLRLQTDEEHRFCMGCHGALGVAVDTTFSFARKVPGAVGWRVQSLRGLHDRPQRGHLEPEVLTYFRRVGGGDELRANRELLHRFFEQGTVDAAQVRRAAVGGDRDLFWLLAPSRPRALDLNKAYLAIVREQSFDRGRDAVLAPAVHVHAHIDEPDTGLAAAGQVFRDGRLHLTW
jgi:hypothetical protein